MQNNINSEELRALQVPLPPRAIQEKIAERIAAGRAKIAVEREAAERLAKDVSADVEALILGSKNSNRK